MCGECSIHATEVPAYEVLVRKTERKRNLRKPKWKPEHNTVRISMCEIYKPAFPYKTFIGRHYILLCYYRDFICPLRGPCYLRTVQILYRFSQSVTSSSILIIALPELSRKKFGSWTPHDPLSTWNFKNVIEILWQPVVFVRVLGCVSSWLIGSLRRTLMSPLYK